MHGKEYCQGYYETIECADISIKRMQRKVFNYQRRSRKVTQNFLLYSTQPTILIGQPDASKQSSICTLVHKISVAH